MGHSLYQYGGSSPWMGGDPLGLQWGPFDLADDFLAESAGSQGAFIQQLIRGANVSLQIGMQLAQLNPTIAAAMAVYKIANGTFEPWDVLDIIPFGHASALFGKALVAFNRTDDAYHVARGAARVVEDVVAGDPWSVYKYVKKYKKAPDGFAGGKKYWNDPDRFFEQNYKKYGIQQRGQKLPTRDRTGKEIKYREWDIEPKSGDRGVKRIVTGSDGSAYYTTNHYLTFIPLE